MCEMNLNVPEVELIVSLNIMLGNISLVHYITNSASSPESL